MEICPRKGLRAEVADVERAGQKNFSRGGGKKPGGGGGKNAPEKLVEGQLSRMEKQKKRGSKEPCA